MGKKFNEAAFIAEEAKAAGVTLEATTPIIPKKIDIRHLIRAFAGCIDSVPINARVLVGLCHLALQAPAAKPTKRRKAK